MFLKKTITNPPPKQYEQLKTPLRISKQHYQRASVDLQIPSPSMVESVVMKQRKQEQML